MNTYELKFEEFKGPLDKLLELIEAKKLEITKLNLAEVTADFLAYLKTLENVHPKILADFVSIAAKLILIKSHTLLPGLLGSEEEAEIGELERRLRIYKELKGAEKIIQSLWAKNISYGREFLLNIAPGGFYLSDAVHPNDLKEAFDTLIRNFETIMPKRESGTLELVSFEEKLKELLERIAEAASSSFNELVHGKKKAEIVVFFLALLHLLKDSLVKIRQEERFSEIRIEKQNDNKQ